MRIIWTLLTALLLSMPSARAQVDPCACHAVSRQDGGSGSGTCTKPGTGRVPCFALIELSDTGGVNGQAQDGICDRRGCSGARNCAYTIKNVVIVASSCASECIRGAVSNQLRATIVTDGVHGTSVGKPLSPGRHQIYSIGAHKSWKSVCGTPPQNRTLKFTNDVGAEVFSVKFTFGCSDCMQGTH